MVDLGEDEERFYNFMMPLTSMFRIHSNTALKNKYKNYYFFIADAFESIGNMLMDTNSYPSEEAKKALIGLSRDLRGLTFSSSKKNAYMMFFDWMYDLNL